MQAGTPNSANVCKMENGKDGALRVTASPDGYEIAAEAGERALLLVSPASTETGESKVTVYMGNEPEDPAIAEIVFGNESVRIDIGAYGRVPAQRMTFHERDNMQSTCRPARFTIDEVVAMIQDAECLIDVGSLMRDGRPVTRREYGQMLIDALCAELKDKRGAP